MMEPKGAMAHSEKYAKKRFDMGQERAHNFPGTEVEAMDTPTPEGQKMSEIEVTLHGHSFKAAGPAEEVTKLFVAFVHSIEKELEEQPTMADDEKGDPGAELARTPRQLGSPSLFERRGNLVILKRMPQTAQSHADAILLLLHGFHTILEQERVLGTRLAKAAKETGLGQVRLGRLIRPNRQYVDTQGERKGLTYALNGQGLGRAEELARELVARHV